MDAPLSVVTGGFSYTGRFIARRLLEAGERVRTLTAHPERDPFGGRVSVAPLAWHDPRALAASLQGARTLYNTYWIRFPWGGVTFEHAVARTRLLLRAAEEAGVERLVHISITHASPASPLPYFRAKGLVEEAIRGSRLSAAILRPTLIFGPGDVLINNIAWLLRRVPVFALPGRGRYRVQPVFVDDVARLAVEAARRRGTECFDAVGPETYPFRTLVRLVARAVGSRALILPVPAPAALALAAVVGRLVDDVVLTRDELRGLRAELLVSGGPVTAPTSFRDWLERDAAGLGLWWASELDRHFRAQPGATSRP
jgi:NADH dehydrogenase